MRDAAPGPSRDAAAVWSGECLASLECLRRRRRGTGLDGLPGSARRCRELVRAEDDFFGTRMFWSSPGYEDEIKLLSGLGFTMPGRRVAGRGYGRTADVRDERHPIVLVQKPDEPGRRVGHAEQRGAEPSESS